ncbi:SRPBCC domain-containing protein [Phenylobacterium sp.]|uniref:SRPBCC domain-containing protein n=1 Tax=Phenylobacterium sp. TaxID=1871053 RepID=UPI00356A7146
MITMTSKRKLISAVAGLALLSVLGFTPATAQDAKTSPGLSFDGSVIHQEAHIPASPQRIYETLLSTNDFDKVVKMGAAYRSGRLGAVPTKISTAVGGEFTLFGGFVVGRNMELVPNVRIVQAWRENEWTPGVYSIVRIQLTPEVGGTKILFDQAGFQADAGPHLTVGWQENYWKPMAAMFN